ncbi:hypothetical protein C8Q73DRAFT_668112 [Cubamyces lactineus]|nr:hypothetical protein C8Q73DRAFT_668112 [Cubamyces lactineus]
MSGGYWHDNGTGEWVRTREAVTKHFSDNSLDAHLSSLVGEKDVNTGSIVLLPLPAGTPGAQVSQRLADTKTLLNDRWHQAGAVIAQNGNAALSACSYLSNVYLSYVYLKNLPLHDSPFSAICRHSSCEAIIFNVAQHSASQLNSESLQDTKLQKKLIHKAAVHEITEAALQASITGGGAKNVLGLATNATGELEACNNGGAKVDDVEHCEVTNAAGATQDKHAGGP